MRKFVEYVKLREMSAMNMGKDIFGGANNVSLDANSEAAVDTALQAFLLILGAKGSQTIGMLKSIVQSVPEVKDQVEQMLSQHDFDSLKDLGVAASRAAKRISSNSSKGLGDVSSGDASMGNAGSPQQPSNAMVPNAADSYKGEAYLIETKAICSRCGAEARASIYDINAGKAKCRECGGFLNKSDKPEKKRKSRD